MNDVARSVAKWAKIEPGRLAVVDEAAAITYGELDERANRWVAWLVRCGAAPGDGVLLLLPNRFEWIELLVAVNRANVLPYVLSTQLASIEVARIATETNAKVVITARSLNVGDQIGDLVANMPLAQLFVEDFADAARSIEPVKLKLTDTSSKMIVLFTSGTTGKPKGVIVPQSVFDLSLCDTDHIRNPQTHLLCRPLFFRAHLAAACSAIQEGNTVALSRHPSAGHWSALIERLNISLISLGPGDLLIWLQELEREGSGFPISLTQILTTGAPLTPMIRARLKPLIQGVRATDFYGTSEAGGIAMIDDSEWESKQGSCGKPMFFAKVTILDEQDRPLEAGLRGEICVGTHHLFTEYYRDPESTSAACAGEYRRTGDIGYFDEEGYLYVTGRKHDVIHCGGYCLHPQEVESVLRESDEVEEAVVVGRDGFAGSQEPIAFVLLRDRYRQDENATAGTKQALLTLCESRLAAYKVPADMIFVAELPRNAAGKADSRELLRRLSQEQGALTPKGGCS
ncbi:class I adenylate-forming enzyme family protein [Cohnella yongneupensis]|uniref:Class I adenylate-forming enzyme family protein n=1 Tax=Cohnella yongneupensis TaxID=425006 RepID=A0ABW0R069_9BACL